MVTYVSVFYSYSVAHSRVYIHPLSQSDGLSFDPLCRPPPQLLTNHYEQSWKYYCLPSGWGSYGMASDEELLLTKKIFWGVLDSLSQRVR